MNQVEVRGIHVKLDQLSSEEMLREGEEGGDGSAVPPLPPTPSPARGGGRMKCPNSASAGRRRREGSINSINSLG